MEPECRLKRWPSIRWAVSAWVLPPYEVDWLDRSLAHVCKVVDDTDNGSVCALTVGWECTCEAIRIRVTPYGPASMAARPPELLTEGMKRALGGMRTLSRVAKDALRVVTNCLRDSLAHYGWLLGDLVMTRFLET